MRNLSSSLILLILSATAALAACDGGSATHPDQGDGGVPDAGFPLPDGAPDASDDAPTRVGDDAGDDAAPDGAGDGGSPDAADASDAADGDAGPTPTLLVAGGGALLGVTTDNFVIYSGSGAVNAVPISGGTPVAIFPSGNQQVYVQGSVVYTLGDVTGPCPEQRPLIFWTSAHGTVTASTSATILRYGDVATDGSKIAYQAWTDATCAQRGVRVSKLTGVGPDVLAVPAHPCAGYGRDPNVPIQAFFAPNGVLLTQSSCAEDGGQEVESDLFATSLDPRRNPWAVGSFLGDAKLDPTGAWMWLTGPGGGGQVVRTLDGTVAASDPSAQSWVSFDATGDHMYFVANGALKQLTLRTTPPTTSVLAPSGVSRVADVDPNGQFLLDLEAAPGDGGAGALALYLRAVAPGASPTLLLDDWKTSGASFTADGKYAVAFQGGGTDVLWSLPTGAASPSQVATGVFSYAPLRGAEVMVMASTGGGTASIVDVSGSAPPWRFATDFGGMLAAPDGAAIVYTTNTSSPAGLYVVAVP